MTMWDVRDKELKIRERLAGLVAEKLSGVSKAQPEANEYIIADKLGEEMERMIEDYLAE
jgi:hypothetical protein